MEDSYKTVANDMRVRTKIKKCKFITSIKNVNTVKEAENFITDTAEEFVDATHNVYAFKVGLGDQAVTRCSDDGEPSGSSGPPALQALEGEGLTNVAVVVTRYFGGVKHGVGGLIRAYGGCVREAITEAGIEEKDRYLELSIAISPDLMGRVINDLEGSAGEVKDTVYDDEDGLKIIAVMKPSRVEPFTERIKEVTGGQADVEQIGEEYV